MLILATELLASNSKSSSYFSFFILGCRAGWTQVEADTQIKCWRHEGVHPVNQAAGVCAGLYGVVARLPLPLNSEMNSQFAKNLADFGITGNVALDGTDLVTEGKWIDSTNR